MATKSRKSKQVSCSFLTGIREKVPKTQDELLKLQKCYNQQALEFLKKNADKFPHMKRLEIRAKIVEKLDSYGKEFLTRQTFEGEYVNLEELSDSNGFTMLNIDKIEAIISYIAENVSNLFKVKLMKMLWYSDVQ